MDLHRRGLNSPALTIQRLHLSRRSLVRRRNESLGEAQFPGADALSKKSQAIEI